MDPDRIRTVVDEVCLALGPTARAADVEAVAAAVLGALGMDPAPIRSTAASEGVVAILLDLPLDSAPSPDRSTVSAYSWERIQRAAGAVVQLADRVFPGIPVRIRTSSVARLTAGLRPDDLPGVFHNLERAAADAGVERIMTTWADLSDAAPGDLAVLEALPLLLDATTRLFGRIDLLAAHGTLDPRHLTTYTAVLSRSVRAGVLNAADRVLAGCRGPAQNRGAHNSEKQHPGVQVEIVVAPPPSDEASDFIRDTSRRALDGFSPLASWTGLEWQPPRLVRCADCPIQSPSILASLAGSRFKGWPVPDEPTSPWAPVPADRLADALSRLAERGLEGVFRMSDPGGHSPIPSRSAP